MWSLRTKSGVFYGISTLSFFNKSSIHIFFSLEGAFFVWILCVNNSSIIPSHKEASEYFTESAHLRDSTILQETLESKMHIFLNKCAGF